ncbi:MULTISPECIES: aldo/keto reductase [unclassified Prochlorococcus]|uniref:aldo/keto reductase n=1 Tax=unclassified Prochlorococcus TaxID=2627481 RepID=UPI0005337916|nr:MULTISPECIES: aldo/keto reductase [unclassified Prochlorococcus]KGG14763.1 Aldo/keto reductase family [Prochlorococcus sp. MIT 0602]KGG15806.1 Aldo/keto reductase family [Prochlorococcus sp. MIT 0603]
MFSDVNSVPTRRFGRTEINMPILSIGGMRFQQSWKDLAPEDILDNSQTNLEEILQFAAKNGFHHLETARHYGTSELQLGWGKRRIIDCKRIIQTKIPPREDPTEFEEELQVSFSNLQCKKLHLLAIHGLNLPEHLEQTLRPGGCMDVVRRWQNKGLIDHVGFSTHGETDLIVKAIETNEFDYVNLHWYFIFQDNEPALSAAAKYDLGVFVISPTDKGGHLHSPSDKLLELCLPLHPIVFNDLFCLSDHRVHTLSVGISSIQDFNLHLQAVNLFDQRHCFLPEITKRLSNAANASLGEEWMNTWKDGLPSWKQTPGHINIPVLMWLYTLYKSWDMDAYVQARYGLLGNGSHWFPGANSNCLDGEVSEDSIRLVLRLSPWPNKIIERLRELRERYKGSSLTPLSSN